MNLEEIEVKIDKPYPQIKNAQDDYKTVAILKDLSMSRIGELSAILSYTYQSVVSKNVLDDVSEVLEEIGIVEMMHLDLLMHATKEFGGVPTYEDSQGSVFNTKYINYNMKLKDILENNIKMETVAIEKYNYAIQNVSNESLKNLFARIIEDEKRHIEIFRYILNNVKFLSI